MMKLLISVVIWIYLIFVCNANAQMPKDTQMGNNVPRVIVAVAPAYPLIALSALASGEVVLEVTINSDGLVTTIKSISGDKTLIAGSKHAAERWKFEPVKDKVTDRKVQLSFVYHLVPRGTPPYEMLPVFKPPYRVEIIQEKPDDTPLPQSSLKKNKVKKVRSKRTSE